jgi:hypothetical protein
MKASRLELKVSRLAPTNHKDGTQSSSLRLQMPDQFLRRRETKCEKMERTAATLFISGADKAGVVIQALRVSIRSRASVALSNQSN